MRHIRMCYYYYYYYYLFYFIIIIIIIIIILVQGKLHDVPSVKTKDSQRLT